MSGFLWGGPHHMTVKMDWKTGDDIWEIGDLVDHDGIFGIVDSVISRQRLGGGTAIERVRFTYLISIA